MTINWLSDSEKSLLLCQMASYPPIIWLSSIRALFFGLYLRPLSDLMLDIFSDLSYSSYFYEAGSCYPEVNNFNRIDTKIYCTITFIVLLFLSVDWRVWSLLIFLFIVRWQRLQLNLFCFKYFIKLLPIWIFSPELSSVIA